MTDREVAEAALANIRKLAMPGTDPLDITRYKDEWFGCIEVALRKRYVQGWKKGVRDFAIWRDGEQLVGCTQKPLKEVLAKGPNDAY